MTSITPYVPHFDGRGSRCTIQRRNGEFCDEPSAKNMPFPICMHHAATLYEHIKAVVDRSLSTASGKLAGAGAVLRPEQAARVAREALSVVYYVKVGDMLKIGYTEGVLIRMRAYPPFRQLLATEPGGRILETRRHEQFAAHRVAGNEWFTMAQPIIDHVNALRRAKRQQPFSLT